MVLADQWVPPFTEVQPLHEYGIHLPEHAWANVTALLNALSVDEVSRLQDAVARVYDSLFKNPVATALHISLSRMMSLPDASS